MKQLVLILSAFIVLSCSQLMEVVQEPAIEEEKTDMPLTKSVKPKEPISFEALHKIQTDHITMLVNGVMFIDSVFVQTLTEKDMAVLKINEEEQAFSRRYVKELNDGLKHKDESVIEVQ